MNRPIKLLIVGWSCIMMGALLLLIREYRYIVDQSYKLIALKAEYENHLMAVSRIIYEYNTLRDRSDYFESQRDDEKKNEKIVRIQTDNFPAGAHVVSSDDRSQHHFLIINRELEHLKKSTIAYMQKQKLSCTLNPHQWQDYTEHVRQSQQKKPVRSSRSKCMTRDRMVQAYKKKLHKSKRAYGSTDFILAWPVDRSLLWLSSLFGPRKKANGAQGFHGGIDMAACKGTRVTAAASGIVVETRREKDSGGWGNTIVIAHNPKYRTRYAHLNTMNVQTGQQVDRGQIIGTVGDTGRVRSRGKDASHLHFEVYVFGKKVDPLAFLA